MASAQQGKSIAARMVAMKNAMRSFQKFLKFGNLEDKTKPTRLAVWLEHL